MSKDGMNKERNLHWPMQKPRSWIISYKAYGGSITQQDARYISTDLRGYSVSDGLNKKKLDEQDQYSSSQHYPRFWRRQRNAENYVSG